MPKERKDIPRNWNDRYVESREVKIWYADEGWWNTWKEDYEPL